MITVAPQMQVRMAEFFAGIGLVREALQPLGIKVVWANDIEEAKLEVYSANHDARDFHLGDIRKVSRVHLPQSIHLATSSFPCVDLSLAGNRRGLVGGQSGMFWEFARVLEELGDTRPKVVLLENVLGFATSHDGKDLTAALCQLALLGYSCDVFTVDARHFVAQSRPRMFVVGILGPLPKVLSRGIPPLSDTRPEWVRRIHIAHQAVGTERQAVRTHFLELPSLPIGPADLTGIVEHMSETDERWWGKTRVAAFTDSLSSAQAIRLDALRRSAHCSLRTAYRRTRNGVARWEVRRDGIGGCLRTTGGGSSRQALVELGNGSIRVRWMTPIEYARMMGAGSYKLRATTDNQALFGFGDAVVVDVVRWIGEHYLLPLFQSDASMIAA